MGCALQLSLRLTVQDCRCWQAAKNGNYTVALLSALTMLSAFKAVTVQPKMQDGSLCLVSMLTKWRPFCLHLIVRKVELHMEKDSEGTDWGAGGSTFAANLAYKLYGTHYFHPFLTHSNIANKPQTHNISVVRYMFIGLLWLLLWINLLLQITAKPFSLAQDFSSISVAEQNCILSVWHDL